MKPETITATQALNELREGRRTFIDVRSEGEFAQGFIPGFQNSPILNDDERHQVGLTYKQKGQDAAIALGHQLVDPARRHRVHHWQSLAQASPTGEAYVTCWRGGLRSQIATTWMGEAQVSVKRIIGGYKAMRHELLQPLAAPPPFIVLSGLTGSGKTQLLSSLPVKEKVDLEGLAKHRGSSFGAYHNEPQPAQQTFENAIGMSLRGISRSVVVEDEGVSIGSVHLPPAIRAAIVATPVIYVDVDASIRAKNICEEYVFQPLKHGITADILCQKLVASVQCVNRRLGGALTTEVIGQIQAAFQQDPTDAEAHAPWITTLLVQYYDRGYTYAFERLDRSIRFRGNYEECQQWILAQFS